MLVTHEFGEVGGILRTTAKHLVATEIPKVSAAAHRNIGQGGHLIFRFFAALGIAFCGLVQAEVDLGEFNPSERHWFLGHGTETTGQIWPLATLRNNEEG